MSSQPPPLLRRLLAWILPSGRVRDGLLGDLDELYDERLRSGRAGADLWYARQLVSAAVHYPLRRLWAPGPQAEEGVLVDGMVRDFGYALRTFRRRPGFAAVIVLTLALGIGANTAVFSVVRSVLLRPLPFPEEERLATVLIRSPEFEAEDWPSSPPEYVAYRDGTRSWEELGAYTPGAATVAGDGGEPERIDVAFATANLFVALRTEARLGRVFTAQEDRAGSDDVAVLGHAFWTSRYGGDPRVIGRTVLLDGAPRTVIGVLPPDFRFPSPSVRVWLPLALTPQDLTQRGNHSLFLVGRLRPGVAPASAESELAALVPRLNAEGADLHEWHSTYLRPLRTEMVGDVSRTLWVMLGAVGLVLVIACANVANLLLVRAEERAQEMSLRTALGASRRRLVSQLLAESVVMAGVGGLAGLAVAYVGVEALRMAAPADLPRLDDIAIDGTVLAFTTVLTVAAGILFGLAPALHAGRADLHGALREEGRSGTAGRKRIRLRELLVVAETALAVVLLVAAGLLLQSFRHLMAVDPGFRSERVLTASMTVPIDRYGRGRGVVDFYESLLPRIASLPGVSAAGAALRAPLAGALVPTDVAVDGWVAPADAPRPIADLQTVTPGYFAAMGIPLLEGRAFDERDGIDAPLVAIVSASLAREYWPGRSPLRGRIRLDWGDLPWAEVVGVVPDVRYEGLDRPPVRGAFYLAHAQTPVAGEVSFESMTLTIRTSADPTALVAALRGEVQALDPSIPLYEVRTMEQAVADTTATQRFSMLLQLLFASVALSLAAVGLYAMLAFTVARRRAEIGIRMALGAERSRVQRMVVRQGMGTVAVALAVGLGGALATGRVLGSLLFGVSPGDPVTYATVVGVLLTVALLACWIPARRASGVDPGEALRAGG